MALPSVAAGWRMPPLRLNPGLRRLALPIIRPVPSRLLGWTYDGSDAARRRAAAQLPVIGLRPRA